MKAGRCWDIGLDRGAPASASSGVVTRTSRWDLDSFVASSRFWLAFPPTMRSWRGVSGGWCRRPTRTESPETGVGRKGIPTFTISRRTSSMWCENSPGMTWSSGFPGARMTTMPDPSPGPSEDGGGGPLGPSPSMPVCTGWPSPGGPGFWSTPAGWTGFGPSKYAYDGRLWRWGFLFTMSSDVGRKASSGWGRASQRGQIPERCGPISPH